MRQLNPQEPLLVGHTATFECTTHGSRPQATIHWLFQGVRHDAPMNGEHAPIRVVAPPAHPSHPTLTDPPLSTPTQLTSNTPRRDSR